MTVSNPSAIAGPYAGNGVTTVFTPSPPLVIRAAADLVLTSLATATDIETVLVLGVDYNVTGAGTFTGCTVTLTAPLAVGKELTIRRVVSLVQLSDFRNQGAFFRELHEDAFDYLMMVCQQQQEQINRFLAIATSFPDDELLGLHQKMSLGVDLGATFDDVLFNVPTANTDYHVIVTTDWMTTWSIPVAQKTTMGFRIEFGNPAPGSPPNKSTFYARVYV